MTAITANTRSRENSGRNGGKLVLKLWVRAGAAAAVLLRLAMWVSDVRKK